MLFYQIKMQELVHYKTLKSSVLLCLFKFFKPPDAKLSAMLAPKPAVPYLSKQINAQVPWPPILSTVSWPISTVYCPVCSEYIFSGRMNIQKYLWLQNPTNTCMNEYMHLKYSDIQIYLKICNSNILKIQRMNVWIYLQP